MPCLRMRAPGGRPAAGNRSKPSAPSGKEAHSAPSPTKTQILTDLALKDLTPTEVVCVGEWRGPGTWGGVGGKAAGEGGLATHVLNLAGPAVRRSGPCRGRDVVTHFLPAWPLPCPPPQCMAVLRALRLIKIHNRSPSSGLRLAAHPVSVLEPRPRRCRRSRRAPAPRPPRLGTL